MKQLWLVPIFVTVSAFAGDAVPKPIDFGSKEISVCVAVPNLQTLLDNSETFVKPFLSDGAKPGAFKAALGAAMGDPELTGLDFDRPVVCAIFKAPPIMVPGGEPPPWALYLPAKSADAFAAVWKQAGMQATFDNNLLIVARSEDALKRGVDQKALYAKFAEAKFKGDCRVYLNVTNLFDTYMPLLETQFNNFLPMIGMGAAMGRPDADPMAIQKLLKLEAKLGKALVSQVDIIQHDISFKPDALQIETIYAAKDGTPLFDLLSSPPTGKSKTLGLLTTAGMMTTVVRCDPAKYSAAINRFVDDLGKDPAFAEILDDSAKALVKQVTSIFGGEYSTSVSMLPDVGIDQEVACTTPDEKAFVDAMEKMADQFKPEAPLGKFYSGIGMKLNTTIDKNVREHDKVSVGRRKMDFDTTGMKPDQAASIKAMSKDIDFATTHGMYLSANRSDALDAMLDNLDTPPKKEIELKSVKSFGDGKQLYLDADWAGLLKGVMTLQPNNPAMLLLGRLKSTEPVTMAGNFDAGRLFIQSSVPTAPFTDLAAAIRPLMMMRGQRRPQRPPAPPEPDKKKDDSF